MSSDRARKTYEASRQYKGIIAQQGRVTLEADVNEAQAIEAEALRHATLDIVGPAGTPDDGYALSQNAASVPPTFDFQVGKGTMYVGGVRVWLPDAIAYSSQSEWLDHSTDDLWEDPSTFDGEPGTEFVYLLLREQEVSAVEDTALKDMALGGPDTAQRLRLVQRVVRLPVKSGPCSTALGQAEATWATQGAAFDPTNMALTSPGRLQVTFLAPAAPSSPCDPTVAGGYLGADNQLIRIQISAYDPKTQKGKIVWSFNNASFLYRATASDNITIQLASTPVDSYHSPKIGGVVEVLRSAVKLDGPMRNDNYIAAHTGIFSSVATYGADTKTVTLVSGAPVIPQEYLDDLKANPVQPLFVRLWEAEVEFTLGQAVLLGTTGIQVTLSGLTAGGSFTLGQYWHFAVRPAADTVVYPQRYFDAPQPPEGPRLWACPLGVIASILPKLTVTDDCRKHFDNLVDLTARGTGGGCCNLLVGPLDVGGGALLQASLDNLASLGGGTLCLKPGTYSLTQPLRLGRQHSGIVIESCQPRRAILQAAPGTSDLFLDGLIVLTSTSNITISGLQFLPPLASFATALAAVMKTPGGPLLTPPAPQIMQSLVTSVGIRGVSVAGLTIRDCDFVFNSVSTPSLPPAPIFLSSFQVGIFAGAECSNWCLERLHFSAPMAPAGTASADLSVGILCAPSTVITTFTPGTTALSTIGGNVTVASVDNWVIRDSVFNGTTLSVFLYGVLSTASVASNQSESAYAGFWFFSLRGGFSQNIDTTSSLEPIVENDKAIAQIVALCRLYPPPPEFKATSVLIGPTPWSPHSPAIPGFAPLHSALAALESAVPDQSSTLRLSLLVNANRVNPAPGAASASGLIVALGTPNPNAPNTTLNSTSMISGNEILGSGQTWPIAVLQNVPRYVVSANVIVNQGGGRSLVTLPAPTSPPSLGVISGNVLQP